MPTYTVLTTLRHDGETYRDGDPITLGEREAQALLRLDPPAIAKTTAIDAAAESATGAERPEGQALTDAIRAAITRLDREDKSLWTAGGKPQVAAIEAVLGYQISAAERDAALEQEGQ